MWTKLFLASVPSLQLITLRHTLYASNMTAPNDEIVTEEPLYDYCQDIIFTPLFRVASHEPLPPLAPHFQ